MKAAVMNAAGGPEVLAPADIAAPTLTRPSDVLVKLYAAGVIP
jgi:NADPH:quinone reductase